MEAGCNVCGFEEGVEDFGDVFGVWGGDAFVDGGFGNEVSFDVLLSEFGSAFEVDRRT